MIIRVVTPTDIRIERVKQREFARFGKRVLKNGDMYEDHQKFITWAARYDTGGLEMRSKVLHDKWLSEISCNQIEIDGTHIENEIQLIEKYLSQNL